MESLTGLIAAFARMLDEPRNRHRAVDNLNRFIVQNYLMAAHAAAVRTLVRQWAQELDGADTRALVEQTAEVALESLACAQERLDQAVQEGGWGVRPHDTQELGTTDFADQLTRPCMVDAVAESESLSAMHLLEQRLQALRADISKITLRCGALGHALYILRDQARLAAERLRAGSGILHRDCAEPPTLDNGAQRAGVQLQTVDFQYPSVEGQSQRAEAESWRVNDGS